MKSGLLISILVIFYFQAFSQDCSLRVSYDVIPSCPGASSGEINLKVEGNQGEVSVKWEDGTVALTRRHLKKGIYHVLVRDANNCSVSKKISISEHRKQNISVIHAEYQFKLNGVANIKRIAWMDSEGQIIGRGKTFNANKQGSYNLFVVDNNKCTYSEKLEIE